MQQINYKMCTNSDDVKKELHHLVEKEKLKESEIPEVDVRKILQFFESDIGARLKAADNINREFRYSLLSSAKNFFPGGGDDKILLQGVIDCYFEENGELVVIDFKTDKVTQDTVKERATYYTPQLDAYAEALERITGKQVKERIIYFFATNTPFSL